MARSIAFDRDEVLLRAIELFWEQGYKHTTLDHLTKAMGINRFSVYNSFGDKHALYLQALATYRAVIADVPLTALEQTDGIAAIVNHFDFMLASAQSDVGKRGCLMVNASLEVAPKDELVAEQVELQFGRLEHGFISSLEQAQAAGEINGVMPHKVRATALVSMVNGIIVLARSGNGLQRIAGTVAAIKQDIVHW